MSEIKQVSPGRDIVCIDMWSQDLTALSEAFLALKKEDPERFRREYEVIDMCKDFLLGSVLNYTRLWQEQTAASKAMKADKARQEQEAREAAAVEAAKKAETSARREPARVAGRKRTYRDGQFCRLSDAERLKVATVGAAKIAASIHSTQETVARAVGGHKIRAITAQAIRNELSRGAK